MSDELTRWNIVSGSPFEPLRGYARAVEVGDHMWISGTTAIWKHGQVIAPGDPYLQTKYVIACLRTILNSRGFLLEDVVRTRLYITEMNKWDDYARAHRETFEKIRPASSIVEVRRLIDPRVVIEIEAEAMRGATQTEQFAINLPEGITS